MRSLYPSPETVTFVHFLPLPECPCVCPSPSWPSCLCSLQGVVTAAVSLITCLCKKNPDDFKTCISLAVSRLSRVSVLCALTLLWEGHLCPSSLPQKAISLRLAALASSRLQLQSSAFTSQLFLHAAGADISAVCSLAAVAEVLRAGAGATKHPKAVCSFLFVFLFFLFFLPPHCPQNTLGLSVSESDLKGPVLLGRENMTGMVS